MSYLKRNSYTKLAYKKLEKHSQVDAPCQHMHLFTQNEKLTHYPLKMAKLTYVEKENKQQLMLSRDMNGLDCVLVEEYG